LAKRWAGVRLMRKKPFLELGLVKRLSHLIDSEHAELRLSALWAVKNLVHRCSSGTKRAILKEVGWNEIEK
jgi:armadillo repeat-containing protein 8